MASMVGMWLDLFPNISHCTSMSYHAECGIHRHSHHPQVFYGVGCTPFAVVDQTPGPKSNGWWIPMKLENRKDIARNVEFSWIFQSWWADDTGWYIGFFYVFLADRTYVPSLHILVDICSSFPRNYISITTMRKFSMLTNSVSIPFYGFSSFAPLEWQLLPYFQTHPNINCWFYMYM